MVFQGQEQYVKAKQQLEQTEHRIAMRNTQLKCSPRLKRIVGLEELSYSTMIDE